MGDYLIHQYDSIYGRQNIIIAHRGYWKSESEKNKKAAFIRAFDNGFGIETDLRDIKGKIVISHDMPGGSEMTPLFVLSCQLLICFLLSFNS